MKELFKKLDNFIDTMWRNTVASILYYFDNKKDEVDIDWLNMANNMKLDEKKYWENRTQTYIEETKNLDKWNQDEKSS